MRFNDTKYHLSRTMILAMSGYRYNTTVTYLGD